MRTSMSIICVFPQLALLLLGTAPLMGQNSAIAAGSVRIQGTVFDENGAPLAKTSVFANRIAPRKKIRACRTRTASAARRKSTGRYAIPWRKPAKWPPWS